MVFTQGRVIIVWLSWLVGGLCGVVILLIVICYCRLMPRHQKSFDEQYLKEHYTIKENIVFSNPGNYSRVKHSEISKHFSEFCSSTGAVTAVQVLRPTPPSRPASYAGDRPPPRAAASSAAPQPAQYASSGMLDDLDDAEAAAGSEALKTRSLPAFLRPRPRPLSSETDLYQLYAKVSESKKHKSRMRSEHAAIIALSKSRSQALDDASAVIVYDQRTQL